MSPFAWILRPRARVAELEAQRSALRLELLDQMDSNRELRRQRDWLVRRSLELRRLEAEVAGLGPGFVAGAVQEEIAFQARFGVASGVCPECAMEHAPGLGRTCDEWRLLRELREQARRVPA
jgi:hypothetical protein